MVLKMQKELVLLFNIAPLDSSCSAVPLFLVGLSSTRRMSCSFVAYGMIVVYRFEYSKTAIRKKRYVIVAVHCHLFKF